MKGLRGDDPKIIAPNWYASTEGFHYKDFNTSPLTCNRGVTSLTWPQVADIKNPRYKSSRYYLPQTFPKISKHSLKNCDSDTGLNLFGGHSRDLTWWPDLMSDVIPTKILQQMQNSSRKSYAKFRYVAPRYWRKTTKTGGGKLTPHQGEGVTTRAKQCVSFQPRTHCHWVNSRASYP